MKPDTQQSITPLIWLALGAFAIGTEGFMIAALLPQMSSDLGVSTAAAGQLVTVFALAYAFSSPILTAVTGHLNRRTLLIWAMAAFAAANLIAFRADGYWSLMAARVLLALAASVYIPAANALAGTLAAPQRRGRALAIVNGGTTIAIALGVPLGAYIGAHFGWRMTFAGVSALALLAVAGLVNGLDRSSGANLHVATLAERLAVVRQPAMLKALLMTTLWAMGCYTVYTYLSPLLAATANMNATEIGAALFTWGAAAAVGVFIGGHVNDKKGAQSVIAPSLLIAALALAAMSAAGHWLLPSAALLPVWIGVFVWGVAAWAVHPAQQARLIGIAGVQAAPIALSLNASFLYLGFSLGAALGSFTLVKGAVSDLGWVGALCEIAALLVVWGAGQRTSASAVVSASK
ncbi:MFS transporter [Rugamonas sp.]|uniref:MFS transporter n=1 Tax=Rugamonas sp. TaxID=1926287 RepID=UPI0025EB70BB|nr:MFS transporter [Rugamonas sp.]